MRSLRTAGAALIAAACSVALTVPAMAAPAGPTSSPSSSPSSAPASAPATATPQSPAAGYTLGTYTISLNDTCTAGTVTLAGWDSRAALAAFTIISPNQSVTSVPDGKGGSLPSGTYGTGVITNGSGVVDVTSHGVVSWDAAAHYSLVVALAAPSSSDGQPVFSSPIAYFSGALQCGGTAVVTDPNPILTLETGCAGPGDAIVVATLRNPNAVGIQTGVQAYRPGTPEAGWNPAQDEALGYDHAMNIPSGGTAQRTLHVAPGDWLVRSLTYVNTPDGRLDALGYVLWQTKAITVPECPGGKTSTPAPTTPSTTGHDAVTSQSGPQLPATGGASGLPVTAVALVLVAAAALARAKR